MALIYYRRTFFRQYDGSVILSPSTAMSSNYVSSPENPTSNVSLMWWLIHCRRNVSPQFVMSLRWQSFIADAPSNFTFHCRLTCFCHCRCAFRRRCDGTFSISTNFMSSLDGKHSLLIDCTFRWLSSIVAVTTNVMDVIYSFCLRTTFSFQRTCRLFALPPLSDSRPSWRPAPYKYRRRRNDTMFSFL